MCVCVRGYLHSPEHPYQCVASPRPSVSEWSRLSRNHQRAAHTSEQLAAGSRQRREEVDGQLRRGLHGPCCTSRKRRRMRGLFRAPLSPPLERQHVTEQRRSRRDGAIKDALRALGQRPHAPGRAREHDAAASHLPPPAGQPLRRRAPVAARRLRRGERRGGRPLAAVTRVRPRPRPRPRHRPDVAQARLCRRLFVRRHFLSQ